MVSCSVCSTVIKRGQSQTINCKNCGNIFHFKCVSLNQDDVDFLISTNKLWTCHDCLKSMKILQQSDSTDCIIPALPQDLAESTDLKLIIKHLDAIRGEQSKLIDLVNQQSKKLDLFEKKFTQVYSELSELKEENKLLKNNYKLLTDRVNSIENNQLNSISNDDAFSEFIDRQSRSRNIIIFNIHEPVDNNSNNSDDSTVKTILRNIGVDIKLVTLQRLGKPSNKGRPIKVTLPSISDVYKVLGSARQLKSIQTFNEVKITSDKTPKQRQHFKDLRVQLNNRLSSGEKNLTIKYFKGCPSIVSTSHQKN